MLGTNEFEAIFRYAAESIIVVDEHGIIQKVNPNGSKLFGYGLEELVGKPIELLIPARFKHGHTKHRSNYAKNPHARNMGTGLELLGITKTGREFPVEISLSPYKTDGRTFTAAFIIDTTLRKEIERKETDYRRELEQEVNNRTLVLKEAIKKLEKTKTELDAALKREQESNLMKNRFISIASHEFRTPLSTILSSANLIDRYTQLGQPENLEKHIKRIKTSINLLTDILDDILSVNKLEEGKVAANPVEFTVAALLRESISECLGMLKPAQQIIVAPHDFNDLTVYQDRKLIRHVLMNLLTNASKFSGEGSQINVGVSVETDAFSLSVTDEGIGIPEHNQKEIFNRFFRADNVEQVQGTGLGLSIVKQYSQLLGGSVTFSSTEGKGSEFKIRFPKELY